MKKNIYIAIALMAVSLGVHSQDPLDPGWLWAERGGAVLVYRVTLIIKWSASRQ